MDINKGGQFGGHMNMDVDINISGGLDSMDNRQWTMDNASGTNEHMDVDASGTNETNGHMKMDVDIDMNGLNSMDNAFDTNETNSILRNEQNIPSNLSDQYSSEFLNVIRNNWSNIKTSTTQGVGLICNQFQYRLALMPPSGHEGQLNYWPEPCGQHENMQKFVKSLLIRCSRLARMPVYINMSPSCICLDAEGQTHFLYSSRSNYSCLDVAFLIHSDATLLKFCDEILSEYSLEDYMMQAVENLESHYEGHVLPITLTFHLTNCTSRIYGLTSLDRGLSGKKCCSGLKAQDQSNDCVWHAISSVEKDGKLITGKTEKRRCIPNKRVAKRLKTKFLSWYKKKKCDSFGEPVSEFGFDERFFFLLEEFLQRNIMVYSDKLTKGKVMCNKGLVTDKSSVRILKVEYRGQNRYAHNLNFLSDGFCHIRAIVDPTAFSSKMMCENCNMGFWEARRLRQHDCSKQTFRSNSLYTWKKTCEEMLNCIDSKLRFEWDQKYGHVVINVVEADKFSVRLHMKLDDSCYPVIVNETFGTLDEVAQYLVVFLPGVVSQVLVSRLQSNLSFLNDLETKLNCLSERTKDMKFSQDGPKLEYGKLMQIKKQVIDHLSKYVVVLQCGVGGEHSFADAIMFEILRCLAGFGGGDKFETRFTGGKLALVTKNGYPIRYISLNAFHSAFTKDVVSDVDVVQFQTVVRAFKDDFNVNLLKFHSPGGVGHGMLSDILSAKNELSFFSPTTEMYGHLGRCVKYGLYGSRKLVIHPDGQYKSAVSMDFSKFYARLLMSKNHSEIWNLGRPLKYEQKDGKFSCVSSRQRKTFANLLLLLIEFCMKGGTEVISALCGKESRWRVPIDGVVLEKSDNGGENMKRTLVSVDGCLWHSCGHLCHMPDIEIAKIDKNHRHCCQTCLNAVKRDSSVDWRLKPTLFKFKSDETMKSPHRLKKTMTYEAVYEHTAKMRREIAQSCSHDHVVIKECEVLRFYFSPLSQFFDHIGLGMKQEFEKVPFYKMFTDLAYQSFPLLSYGSNLTERKVIDAIKAGDLRGYAVVRASSGPNTRKALDIAHPFFFKDASDKPFSSFDVKDKIVSTLLLREMLTNKSLGDFCVTEICSVFEYRIHEAGNSPFQEFQEKYLNSLKRNSHNKLFSQLLKSCLNNSMGLFGFNVQKYTKSVICQNSDFSSMFQMKNFSHGSGVNEDFSMLHFRNRSAIFNLSHLHLCLIEAGKMEMIRFILQFNEFFPNGKVGRLNTDGLSICHELEQTKENLQMAIPTSVVFDVYLKTNICYDEATRYYAFKRSYFTQLGVCPRHETSYLLSLTRNGKFQMDSCCQNYENNEPRLPLNLEILCNVGVILSTNKLCFVNSVTGRSQSKCSGPNDARLSNIENCSIHELNLLIADK